MDFDYKKYSLEKLQDWVHDAMSSDASPHEIYSTIREAVREDYYYHKDRASRAYGLLELLSGNRPVKDNSVLKCDKDDPSPECKGHWDDFWEEHYYPEEHKKDKVKRWVLPVEECKDADTDETEYFVTFPDDLLEAANLKEGDQVEWVDNGDGTYTIRHKCMSNTSEQKTLNYQEAIAAGWEMTDDGIWIKEN